MRAKNEFKFIAEAYNTKLILERIVDGTLMCPEACCGAPVMECKCGPDCEHCNCHEIQKLAKEEDNEGAAGHLRRAAARGAVRHDDDSDAALWKKQMKHQPDVSPERWKELQNKKPKPQSYSKKHPKREDEEYDEYHPGYGKVKEPYEHKTDALVAAGGTKSEDIDKIDLSKWKEYRAEDVMKAVYRQYGKELPSVDSYDWEFSWDKKVRPWLKNKFPNS